MERYTAAIGITLVAAIFALLSYGGYQSEQRRIDCRQQLASSTRTADEIVKICR